MAGEAFSPLPHSVQRRLWGQVVPGAWLTAQVQDSAVFVAEDWVVSIHGKKLSHNLAAMAVLLNSVGQELNEPISVDFPTLQKGSGESFYTSLKRQSQRDRIVRIIVWVFTIVASALAGVFIQRLFFGDGLP